MADFIKKAAFEEGEFFFHQNSSLSHICILTEDYPLYMAPSKFFSWAQTSIFPVLEVARE